MATIALVSCVGAKLGHAAPARELYVSPWFIKARRYVEEKRWPWFVLSARYGLVGSAATIEPYDQTLTDADTWARADWEARVRSQVGALVMQGDAVVVLAGERYRRALVPFLLARGCTVDVPMRGMGIGQQLAWLGGRSA